MRERHARGEAIGDPSRVIVRLYQIGALARRVYRSHTKPGGKPKASARGVTDTRDGKMLPRACLVTIALTRHARGEARGDPSRVIARLAQIGALACKVYRSHTNGH